MAEQKSYRKEKTKQELRFNEERLAFRHFLKEIKIMVLIIMWGVIASGALVFGIFVRLLFFN